MDYYFTYGLAIPLLASIFLIIILKKEIKFFLVILLMPVFSYAQTRYDFTRLQQERLDRGVVAVRMSKDSVLVSWRYLSQDPMETEFDIYRNKKCIAHVGNRQGTYFMDYNPSPKKAIYEVKTKDEKIKIKTGKRHPKPGI